MAHDVFISHSTKDKTVADAVCAKLEGAQIRCWIAPRDVQPGRSFAGEITRAIQQAKVMVLIFSAHSNDSEQVLREVQLAVNGHLHIIQFRIEDVLLNDDLRYFLSTPHWLDAITPPLDAHIDRLTASINALLRTPTTPPVPTGDSAAASFRSHAAAVPTLRGRRNWLGPLANSAKRNPLLVFVMAAAFVFLFLWLVFFRKQAPTVARPESLATPSRAPATQARESPSVPAISEGTRAEMRAYEEWAAGQKPQPTVDPKQLLPITRRFMLRHKAPIRDENFSPDGKLIVTASNDKTVRLWEVATGRQVGEPLQHEGEVIQALFSPDGAQIVTVTHGFNGARFFDAKTRQSIGEPLKALTLSFSRDGRKILTMDRDGVVQIWDAQTRSPIGKSFSHKGTSLSDSAQFSPDAKRVLTTAGETARLWDVESGGQIGDTLRDAARGCFSPDGNRVVTAPRSSGKVAVWNAATGEKLFELNTVYAIYDLQFSPNGKFILTASQDYTARIWDAATGKPHGNPLRHEKAVWMAVLSSDNKRIATASMDNTARLWDAETTLPLSKPLGQDESHNRMRVHFSSEGKWLLTGSDDEVARVWEIGSQQ